MEQLYENFKETTSYNLNYINYYKEEHYLNTLSNPKTLDDILMIYLGRNTVDTYDGNNTLYKESIDHYVLKRLTEDPDFIRTVQFSNYRKYLYKLISLDHNEIISCPFFELASDDLLKAVLDESYEAFIKNMNKISVRKKELRDKIFSGNFTQEEIDEYCAFFELNRDEDSKEHEELISFITNKLYKYPNIKSSFQITSCLLSFALKQYDLSYKKVNFDKSGIRIVLSNIFKGEKLKVKGIAPGNLVYINRDEFKNMNFDIKDAATNMMNPDDKSLINFLLVVFHEITHNYQFSLRKKIIPEETALFSIVDTICNINGKGGVLTYARDIEIHATEEAWGQVGLFTNEYIEDRKLSEEFHSRTTKNTHGTNLTRALIYNKETQDSEPILQHTFLAQNISELIKTNNDYIKMYPMLKFYFNENGIDTKKCLTSSGFSSTITGYKLIRYIMETGKINELANVHLSKYEVNDLITNIYALIIRTIEYATKSGTYSIDRDCEGAYSKFDYRTSENIFNVNKQSIEVIYDNFLQFSELYLNDYKDNYYYQAIIDTVEKFLTQSAPQKNL